ncbi:MAG: hypothetical protein ABR577_06395 [Pyrinomonadaceae bacterium]
MAYRDILGKHSSMILAAVTILSVAAATVFILFTSADTKVKGNKDKSVRALEGLRAKYASINSVHLTADANIALFGSNFRAGTGTFEYWAEGNRYRIKCHTDKHLGFKTDLDISYDGKRFCFFDRGSGILSYRQKDDLRSQIALPNPLFLPVDYLSIDDDECPLCVLRLSDVKSQSSRWNSRATALEVRSQRRDVNTGDLISDLEMPGGKINGQPFKLRVRLAGPSEDDARPAQIERVAPDGRIMASIAFNESMQNSSIQLPRRISINAFDDKGNPALRLEYTVKTIEVNQPIDDSTFIISSDDAEGVWDSDGNRFVKEKKTKPLPTKDQ